MLLKEFALSGLLFVTHILTHKYLSICTHNPGPLASKLEKQFETLFTESSEKVTRDILNSKIA